MKAYLLACLLETKLVLPADGLRLDCSHSQLFVSSPALCICCRFVTVSMTVGPASGALKDKPQDSWTAKDVALTVLIDRCGAGLQSTGGDHNRRGSRA